MVIGGYKDAMVEKSRLSKLLSFVPNQRLPFNLVDLFLDFRILRNASMLAKAIAAEKLIQVFHTHGGKIEGSDIAKDIVATVAEDGEGSEAAAEKLREAYRKVSKTPIIRFNSHP